jgi:hypothetical protein
VRILKEEIEMLMKVTEQNSPLIFDARGVVESLRLAILDNSKMEREQDLAHVHGGAGKEHQVYPGELLREAQFLKGLVKVDRPAAGSSWTAKLSSGPYWPRRAATLQLAYDWSRPRSKQVGAQIPASEARRRQADHEVQAASSPEEIFRLSYDRQRSVEAHQSRSCPWHGVLVECPSL